MKNVFRCLQRSFLVFICMLVFNGFYVFADDDCVNMQPHPNGGGLVATTAYVASSVFVHSSSKVCGRAKVTGGRILEGTQISDNVEIFRWYNNKKCDFSTCSNNWW